MATGSKGLGSIAAMNDTERAVWAAAFGTAFAKLAMQDDDRQASYRDVGDHDDSISFAARFMADRAVEALRALGERSPQ